MVGGRANRRSLPPPRRTWTSAMDRVASCSCAAGSSAALWAARQQQQQQEQQAQQAQQEQQEQQEQVQRAQGGLCKAETGKARPQPTAFHRSQRCSALS